MFPPCILSTVTPVVSRSPDAMHLGSREVDNPSRETLR